VMAYVHAGHTRLHKFPRYFWVSVNTNSGPREYCELHAMINTLTCAPIAVPTSSGTKLLSAFCCNEREQLPTHWRARELSMALNPKSTYVLTCERSSCVSLCAAAASYRPMNAGTSDGVLFSTKQS